MLCCVVCALSGYSDTCISEWLSLIGCHICRPWFVSFLVNILKCVREQWHVGSA